MRQRKIKNIDERLKAFIEYIITEFPVSSEEEFKNSNPLYVEIGCGKGKFLNTISKENSRRNFIGIEGNESVALRALEKVKEDDLKNVLIIPSVLKDVDLWFREESIEGIYLNFSDPWPKDRHEKRRLTSKAYVKSFYRILKNGGFIELKTDNDSLYEFSLKTLKEGNFKIAEEAYDLYESSFKENNVTTEYEEKFKERGLKIHYLKAEKSYSHTNNK